MTKNRDITESNRRVSPPSFAAQLIADWVENAAPLGGKAAVHMLLPAGSPSESSKVARQELMCSLRMH
jgi:hypothetical protein